MSFSDWYDNQREQDAIDRAEAIGFYVAKTLHQSFGVKLNPREIASSLKDLMGDAGTNIEIVGAGYLKHKPR